TSISAPREKKMKEAKEAIKQVAKPIGSGDPRNAAFRLEIVLREIRETQSDLRKIKKELDRLLYEDSLQRREESAGAGDILTATYSIFALDSAGPSALLSVLHPFFGEGKADSAKVPEFLLDEFYSKHPKVVELFDKIAKSESALADNRKRAVQAEDVRRFEEQLASQRAELNSLLTLLRPGAERHVRARMMPAADPVLRQHNIANLRWQKESLENERENLTKEAGKLNIGGLDLDDLREDREL